MSDGPYIFQHICICMMYIDVSNGTGCTGQYWCNIQVNSEPRATAQEYAAGRRSAASRASKTLMDRPTNRIVSSLQDRLHVLCDHLVSGDAAVRACRCPLPHSAEAHLIRPPPASVLPLGWTINQGDDASLRFGTFRAEARPVGNVGRGCSDTKVAVQRPFTLPRAQAVSEMAALLRSEGLVHVPGALSPTHVANLCSLFNSLVPDPESPLDRWGGSAAHLAAAAAAEAAGDEAPYVDRAIQTLFNREAGNESAPFLQYLDIDPPCAVAEAVLGQQAHVIQHNLWETPPGRPMGKLASSHSISH